MNFELYPEANGFHYRISNDRQGAYWISFIAIGTGGHQLTGELNGELITGRSEGYHRIHFPIIHVGARAFEFKEFGEDAMVSDRNEKTVVPDPVLTDSGTEITDANLIVPDRLAESATDNVFLGTPPPGTPYY